MGHLFSKARKNAKKGAAAVCARMRACVFLLWCVRACARASCLYTDVRICFLSQALGGTQVEVLLQHEYMTSKSVAGTGLFALTNTMNHCCEPNVAIVSSHDSFRLKLVAIRSVRRGEELLISYIDETAPREARQRALQSLYMFNCMCKKCVSELK